MWKNFLTYVQKVLTLAKEVERNSEDIKRLEEKFNQLVLAVQRLATQIELNAQQERSARENLLLQLKIEMMEFERQMRRLKPPQDEE
jgi:nitrogen fixation/metabolism regulation signal transduction histidine kinase